MTAPDLSADEKAEGARFGVHDGGDGLPVVRVESGGFDPVADLERVEFNIADTCCGACPRDTCYVDQMTGERP